MSLNYVFRRFGVFLLIVWAGATINFLMPRLAPVNPIRERLLQAVSFGGAGKTDMEAVVATYEARFGLDQPLWKQYLRYLGDAARLDFGVSIANFPSRASDIIMRALPWTLGLLTTATLIAFALGTVLGALLAWPRSPGALHYFAAPFLALSAIPYYLLGLVLVFLLGFTLGAFPLGGGFTLGTLPGPTLAFAIDVIYHSIVPALSIVLSSVGFWALSMRGMMVTVQGEDYVNYAEARGLKSREIFFRYALRNALLPQTTALGAGYGLRRVWGRAGGGGVRVPGCGDGAVPRRADLRLLRHLRRRAHGYLGHRLGDSDPRLGLPAARPAHCLPPMTLSPISAAARRHPQLTAGLIVVFVVLAFGPVGTLFVDTDLARVGSAEPNLSPSLEHLLGTDAAGRDLLAVMVAGTPLTLRVGFLAGAVGLGIGIILGFLAGYFGGLVDTLIRGAADVLLTVPGLLFLVVLATSLRTAVTVDMMALVVASLAWMLPTRTIRAQVLSMRERAYVQVARLSGMSDLEIIARELLPNLLPYLAASFVSAVGAAVLASIGLEALGLGPQNEPTLGMTIYWALYYTSLLRGMWWWWAPPIVMIVLIFIGLFLVSMGLDRIANPRIWKVSS